MSYCPYCGRQVSEDMSFCPGCGAALNTEEKRYTVTEEVSANSGDYKIYLTGLGSASRSEVEDLLEDVLGYTTVSAGNLVSNMPVQIAGNLSLKQAAVVAQAFEEYGVELSVTNSEDEYQDISSQTSSSSLFNSDGSFLVSAAIILATVGAANRLRSITKPKKPSLLQRLFRSLFTTGKRKPVHVRRTIRPRNMSFPYQNVSQPRRTVRQKLSPFGNMNSRPASSKPQQSSHSGSHSAGSHSKPSGSSNSLFPNNKNSSSGKGSNRPSQGHGGSHSHGGHKGK